MYGHPELAAALCSAHASTSTVASALCVELPTDGTAPEWLEIIPDGRFTGRDGRSWLNDAPDAVVAAFNQAGLALPLDWEHASERPTDGQPVAKAAWIDRLEVRDGALWGHFDWTERGRNAVQNRDSRYLSPAFLFRRDNQRVVQLTSVALTDNPNLHLKAINRQEEVMDLPAQIRQALGLDENATADHAVAAITHLKGDLSTAKNSAEQAPSLDKYVPRADHDAALASASNAREELQTLKQSILDKEIDAAIEDGQKAGKITPATADYHKAQCRLEGGLERFRDFVKAAPEVGGDAGLDNKHPDKDRAKALNTEQQKVAAMFGNSAEDLAKYGHETA